MYIYIIIIFFIKYRKYKEGLLTIKHIILKLIIFLLNIENIKKDY